MGLYRVLLMTTTKHLLCIVASKLDIVLRGDDIEITITEASGEANYHVIVTDEIMWDKVQVVASEAVKTGAASFSTHLEFECRRIFSLPSR